MNKKSLLSRIITTIKDYQHERRQARLEELQQDVPGGTQKKLAWFFHFLLPNGGTLVIVLMLIATQSVWARSLPASFSAATSTGTIPYQGRLALADGTPANGSYNMIFKIYNSASGINNLWEEQWIGPNSVAVSDGLFNVMLGSITPISQATISGNSSLWLGITVGTDGEMTPRIQLGSVPYAVQALTVKDKSVTGASIADAAVGTQQIADGAVTAAKLGSDISLTPADGSITTLKLSDSAVTTNKIANGSITKQKLGADVSNIFVQGGNLLLTESTPGWNLSSGTSDRYFRYHITFGTSFVSTPVIVVNVSSFDSSKNYNTRIELGSDNITTTGFDLVIHTWADTQLFRVGVGWISYGYR